MGTPSTGHTLQRGRQHPEMVGQRKSRKKRKKMMMHTGKNVSGTPHLASRILGVIGHTTPGVLHERRVQPRSLFFFQLESGGNLLEHLCSSAPFKGKLSAWLESTWLSLEGKMGEE